MADGGSFELRTSFSRFDSNLGFADFDSTDAATWVRQTELSADLERPPDRAHADGSRGWRPSAWATLICCGPRARSLMIRPAMHGNCRAIRNSDGNRTPGG